MRVSAFILFSFSEGVCCWDYLPTGSRRSASLRTTGTATSLPMTTAITTFRSEVIIGSTPSQYMRAMKPNRGGSTARAAAKQRSSRVLAFIFVFLFRGSLLLGLLFDAQGVQSFVLNRAPRANDAEISDLSRFERGTSCGSKFTAQSLA